MILILTALPFEAKPYIDHFCLEKLRSYGKGRLFQNNEKTVCLFQTGMALKSVEKSLNALINSGFFDDHTVSTILNTGVVASSNPDYKFGDCCQITEVSHQHRAEIYSLMPLCSDFKTEKVLTIDSVCSDLSELPVSKDFQPLLDMELYHLIRILPDELKSRVCCCKIISDFADGQKIEMKQLAEFYDKHAKTIASAL